jgi:hypothetical protein
MVLLRIPHPPEKGGGGDVAAPGGWGEGTTGPGGGEDEGGSPPANSKGGGRGAPELLEVAAVIPRLPIDAYRHAERPGQIGVLRRGHIVVVEVEGGGGGGMTTMAMTIGESGGGEGEGGEGVRALSDGKESIDGRRDISDWILERSQN